jgi:hypothetical protein
MKMMNLFFFLSTHFLKDPYQVYTASVSPSLNFAIGSYVYQRRPLLFASSLLARTGRSSVLFPVPPPLPVRPCTLYSFRPAVLRIQKSLSDGTGV